MPHGGLVAALAAVPDFRRRRRRRHELTGVLAIGACACLTGASSYVAISEWAAAQGQAVLDCLGSEAGLPCESTLRRCLQAADAAALDAAVAGWAGEQLAAEQARAAHAALVPVAADRRVIAIDGKTLRGSAARSTPEQVAAAASGGRRVHLVAALDHVSGVTLGQVALDDPAPTGMHRPACHVLHREPVPSKQVLDDRTDVAGEYIGDGG